MAKNDVEKITEEKIAHGGVLIRFYFDMQHEDKEKLQPILVNLVNEQLMKEPGVVYCYGAIEEPLEKEGVFITSATITMLFESFKPLLSIVFRYAPAGLEILKPQSEMRLKTSELQSMLMDMSSLSINYSRWILEKVLGKEDVEKILKQMENRAEVGKKFLDTRDTGQQQKPGKK